MFGYKLITPKGTNTFSSISFGILSRESMSSRIQLGTNRHNGCRNQPMKLLSLCLGDVGYPTTGLIF